MRTLRFDIVSIFPGMFESPFGDSIIQRAREEGLLDIRLHDLRDYSLNKHRKVDDNPFGGGVGMVMNVEPIARAIAAVKKEVPETRTILLSPGGKPLDQEKAWELSSQLGCPLIVAVNKSLDISERLAFNSESTPE